MTSKAKKSHKALGEALSKLPGFRQGYEKRDRIIRLGNALRKLREDFLELSQSQAARLIGMHQSDLSRLETGIGERGPSMLTVTRVIDAYEHYFSEEQGRRMTISLDVRMTDKHKQTTTVVELLGSMG